MTTNANKRVRAPFYVPDLEERNASVKRAMRALLEAELRPDDLYYLLDMALWRFTEFDKNRYKHATRYRTPIVLGDQLVDNIIHEHVVDRRWLVAGIMENPAQLDDFLELAVVCIVAKAEDIRLPTSGRFGWDRYRAAQLEVVDTATMQPADLDALYAAQLEVLDRLDMTPESRPRNRERARFERSVNSANLSADAAVGVISVEEQLLSLSGAIGRRAELHDAVHKLLVDVGLSPYFPNSAKANYLSYRDAAGRNFINLTATIAHVMRRDLATELAEVEGVRIGGRYPQVHLEDARTLETLRELTTRFTGVDLEGKRRAFRYMGFGVKGWDRPEPRSGATRG